MTETWQIGIDIGGTFTDVVAVDSEGSLYRSAKVGSVVGEPVASVDAALAAVGLGWDQVSDLMHGTTMATNAIVEGKLARVALITTKGFRDTLAIGRQNRGDLYRLDVPPKLPALVPEELRLEVAERLDSDGAVLVPLTQEAIAGALDEVKQLGVEAVAVCLIHAYADPAHEVALGEELAPVQAHVALSHRMNPEAREFERSSATVLNAALMPRTSDHLDNLLARAGNRTRVHLFHSAGGMASADAVKDRPLALALSGPAAGVAAAGRVAGELGFDRAISFDMGGTTTDVCLIVDGAAQISGQRTIAGRPLRQPMVAVESIGAGGGSIARLDSGAIRVGPESAGAEPGPACYGAGGQEATVTDANLLLGYLDAERLLGDAVRLDRSLSEAALQPLAGAFGVGTEEAALGIHRIANANMTRALRRVTVERGVDARECALIAFGGAGPMHAVSLAREFGISRIIVPRFSSMFSALGCLTAELSYAQQQTVRMASGSWDEGRLDALRADLLARLSAPLLAAGHAEDGIAVEDVAAIRYAGQSYAVEVRDPAFDRLDRLDRQFRERHEAQYGFATDEPWELAALRMRLSAPRTNHLPGIGGDSAKSAVPAADSMCWFEDFGEVATPRLDRDSLCEGQRVGGPAVIEDAWSTIVLPPGSELVVDAAGNLHIGVGAGT